jgi:hypothetical protein
MSGKSRQTKRHIHPSMFLMAGLLLIVILGGMSYAKYIHADSGERAAIAYKFYFCSNLLGDETEVRTYTCAPGTERINFTIGNHEDELRYSELPVYYTIAVNEIGSAAGQTTDESKSVTVNIQSAASSGTSGAGSSSDGSTPTSGAITATDAVMDDKITISGLKSGKSYSVTATGTSIQSGGDGYPGYHKTLTAIINIPDDEPVVYKSVDNTAGSYVLLTVWTQNYAGAVDITFPEGLLPDNTDTVMRNWTTDDGETRTYTDSESFINLQYNSHVYRFFVDGGSGTTNFAEGDFTVQYTVEGENKNADSKSLY